MCRDLHPPRDLGSRELQIDNRRQGLGDVNISGEKLTQVTRFRRTGCEFGGPCGDRTHDLRIKRQCRDVAKGQSLTTRWNADPDS